MLKSNDWYSAYFVCGCTVLVYELVTDCINAKRDIYYIKKYFLGFHKNFCIFRNLLHYVTHIVEINWENLKKWLYIFFYLTFGIEYVTFLVWIFYINTYIYIYIYIYICINISFAILLQEPSNFPITLE